jgi:hypothetical protein
LHFALAQLKVVNEDQGFGLLGIICRADETKGPTFSFADVASKDGGLVLDLGKRLEKGRSCLHVPEEQAAVS